MTTPELVRPRAAWSTAFSAQFRLLWYSRRPLFLFGAVLVNWAVAEYIYTRPKLQFWSQYEARLVLQPAWLLFLGVIGGAWAVAVWREQNRNSRPYHWTMPVDVTAHDLARILAGGAWLVLAVALFALTGILLASVHGHGAAVLAASPVFWLAQLLCAAIGYLLVVPVSTLSGRPAEIVLLGIVIFYFGAGLLAIGGTDTAAFKTFESLVKTVFTSKYGLTTPFFGHGFVAAQWEESAQLPAGHFTTWLAATLLWLALTASAVGGALLWVRRRLAQ